MQPKHATHSLQAVRFTKKPVFNKNVRREVEITGAGNVSYGELARKTNLNGSEIEIVRREIQLHSHVHKRFVSKRKEK